MIKASFEPYKQTASSQGTPFKRKLDLHKRSLTIKSGARTRNYWLYLHESKGISEDSKQAQKSIEHRSSYKAFLQRQSVLRGLSAKRGEASSSHYSEAFLTKKDDWEGVDPIERAIVPGADTVNRLKKGNIGARGNSLRDGLGKSHLGWVQETALAPEKPVLTSQFQRLSIGKVEKYSSQGKADLEVGYLNSYSARHSSSRSDVHPSPLRSNPSGTRANTQLSTDRQYEESDNVTPKLGLLAMLLPASSKRESKATSTERSLLDSPYQTKHFPKYKREVDELDYKVPKRPTRFTLASPNFERLIDVKGKLIR